MGHASIVFDSVGKLAVRRPHCIACPAMVHFVTPRSNMFCMPKAWFYAVLAHQNEHEPNPIYALADVVKVNCAPEARASRACMC